MSGGVRAEEQVAERPAQQVSDPPPRLMVRPVVDQVAALAKALQIARPIVTRVVIEVGGCEDDTGLPQPGYLAFPIY